MTGAERARRNGRRFIMLDNVMVVFGFFIVFPLVTLHFADQLGWAASMVGLALGMRQVAQQGLGLLGGALADRFGAKPLIVLGMALRAASFALFAVADSPTLLFCACVLAGLAGALFDPARSALMVKLVRPNERNRFYSILMMLESAAGMLGALAGSLLLAYDFFWVAMAGCGAFVLVTITNMVVLPAYRVALRPTPAMAAARTVLRDRPFMAFVLTMSGYFVLVVQLMLLLPVMLRQLAGTTVVVGWMYSLDAVLSLCLVYPLAKLGERWFRLETRLMAGISMMTVGIGCIAFVHTVPAAFAALTLFFIGTLVAEPARETLMARFARPEARGSYMGLGKIGFGLGGLLGLGGGGYLLDHARAMGAPSLPWMVLALIGAATVLCLHRQFAPAAQPKGGLLCKSEYA